MIGDKTPKEIKAEKQAQERQKKEQLKLYGAYKNLFEMPSAKIVLEDLRKRCYADTPSYVPGLTDREDTFHNEGKRAVYLHIMDMIKRYSQKQKEV